MPTTLDVSFHFDRHGGRLSMPHPWQDRDVNIRFTDIGDIASMLILHGVPWDVISNVEEAADQAFAEHCRVMRERRRLGPLETIGGTGVLLGCMLGAAAWVKGITVILGW